MQAKAKSGEPREAAKAARIAALPVLEALCKAYPLGASKRVMAGLNYLWPWGHTALDLGESICGGRASILTKQQVPVARRLLISWSVRLYVQRSYITGGQKRFR